MDSYMLDKLSQEDRKTYEDFHNRSRHIHQSKTHLIPREIHRRKKKSEAK